MNAKSAHELRAAAEAGARIVVDNFDEIDKLDALAAPVEVMLRVTGVDIDRCPRCPRGLLRRLAVLPPTPAVWDTS